MAFVEYNDGEFVKLEEINHLRIKDGSVRFKVKGDNVTIFSVHKDHLRSFLNHTKTHFCDWDMI